MWTFIARMLPGIAVASLLALPACTRNPGTSGEADRPEPRLGKTAVVFDPARVTEFQLAVQDPRGAPWTARLEISGQRGWEVTSAPGGGPLSDRLVDAIYLQHLLDSMTTLQYTAETPQGPLASFGLEPPLHALRWVSSGQTYELSLGAPGPQGQGRYGHVPGTKTVMIMRGSALQMLELLTSFEVIRHRTLATWTTDEIDEVELWDGARRTFFAERTGDTWVDATKRKLKDDVTAWLDGVTHLRALRFIDEPDQAARAEAAVKKAPRFRIVAKDRKGERYEIAVLPEGERILGVISTRPGAAFELYPESLPHFRFGSGR